MEPGWEYSYTDGDLRSFHDMAHRVQLWGGPPSLSISAPLEAKLAAARQGISEQGMILFQPTTTTSHRHEENGKNAIHHCYLSVNPMNTSLIKSKE